MKVSAIRIYSMMRSLMSLRTCAKTPTPTWVMKILMLRDGFHVIFMSKKKKSYGPKSGRWPVEKKILLKSVIIIFMRLSTSLLLSPALVTTNLKPLLIPACTAAVYCATAMAMLKNSSAPFTAQPGTLTVSSKAYPVSGTLAI